MSEYPRRRGALRYAAWSMGLAAGALGLLLPTALGRGEEFLRWSLSGWLIMALIGVVGGAWQVARHGVAGSGFILAVGTCMLARLFASALGAAFAVQRGMGAVWAFLAGLATGFVPLQVFEIGWFFTVTRRSTRGARSAGARTELG